MSKQYIADQKPFVRDYYSIAYRISDASTEEQFRDIQEQIHRYRSHHRYNIRGFWWFTWSFENKAAHAMWESLQSQLLFRMNVVYDSSGTFGK